MGTHKLVGGLLLSKGWFLISSCENKKLCRYENIWLFSYDAATDAENVESPLTAYDNHWKIINNVVSALIFLKIIAIFWYIIRSLNVFYYYVIPILSDIRMNNLRVGSD